VFFPVISVEEISFSVIEGRRAQVQKIVKSNKRKLAVIEMQEDRFLKGIERGDDFKLNKLLNVMDESITSLIINQKKVNVFPQKRRVKKRREKLNKIYMRLSGKIYMGYPLSEMIGELCEYTLLNFKSGEILVGKKDIKASLINAEALMQLALSLDDEESILFLRGYDNPLNDLLNIMETIVKKLKKISSFGQENEYNYVMIDAKLRRQYSDLIHACNKKKGLSEIIEDLGKFIILSDLFNKVPFHFT
jgi:hypothetical protein